MVYVSSYYILFPDYVLVLSLRSLFVSTDIQKVDPDGLGGREELVGVEGGETLVRICSMRKKKTIFNKW